MRFAETAVTSFTTTKPAMCTTKGALYRITSRTDPLITAFFLRREFLAFGLLEHYAIGTMKTPNKIAISLTRKTFIRQYGNGGGNSYYESSGSNIVVSLTFVGVVTPH